MLTGGVLKRRRSDGELSMRRRGAFRAEEVGAGYLPTRVLASYAMEAWPLCCPLDQPMADGIDQHVEHLVNDVFVSEQGLSLVGALCPEALSPSKSMVETLHR